MSNDRALQSQISEQNPIVLLLAPAESTLLQSLLNFLQAQSLTPCFIPLTDDWLDHYQNFLRLQPELYKVICLFGFTDFTTQEKENLWQLLSLLQDDFPLFAADQSETTDTVIECVLLSSYQRAIRILDHPQTKWENFVAKKQRFFSEFFSRYSHASTFLAQDFLPETGSPLAYALQLFFAPFQDQALYDLPVNWYWLPEQNYIELLQQHLLRPGQEKHFLLRGSVWHSPKTTLELALLFQRYYEKELAIYKVITVEENQKFPCLLTSVNVKTDPRATLESIVQHIHHHSPSEVDFFTQVEAAHQISVQDKNSPKAEQKKQSTAVNLPQAIERPFSQANSEVPAKKLALMLKTHQGLVTPTVKRSSQPTKSQKTPQNLSTVQIPLTQTQALNLPSQPVETDHSSSQSELQSPPVYSSSPPLVQESVSELEQTLRENTSSQRGNLAALATTTAHPVLQKTSLLAVNKIEKEKNIDLSIKNDEINQIDEKLHEIFTHKQGEEKTHRLIKTVQSSKKIIKKKKKRKVLFAIGFSMLVIGGGALSLYFLFQTTQKVVLNSLLEEFLLEQKTNLTSQTASSNSQPVLASTFLEKKTFSSNLLHWQNLLYQKIFASDHLAQSLALDTFTQHQRDFITLDQETQAAQWQLYQVMLAGEGDIQQKFDALETHLTHRMQALEGLETDFQAITLESQNESDQQAWQSYNQLIENEVKKNQQLVKTVGPLKQLLLQKGRTQWLVLLQDNAELRSSGGFLDGAILLSFENGFFVDQQFLTNDQIMQSNFGQKAAPAEIKDLLGESQWYFRDSNWASDFNQASQDSAWYVEQLSGDKVNIVTALNYSTIQKILAKLGTVTLPNGEQIAAPNLEAQFQEKLLTEVTQKTGTGANFRNQVLTAILNQLLHLSDQTQLSQLTDLFYQDLTAKEIFMTSKDQSLQQAFKANVWTGEELNSICPEGFNTNNCFLDSFYQVESNVGVNKVNRFISENITHNLGIAKDFVRHKQTIVFTNSARENTWPLGTYRDFIRFYLPINAEVEKVSFAGQEIPTNLLRNSVENDHRVIGVVIEVPSNSQKTLEITYVLKNSMTTPFSYVFLDQKQAGNIDKKTKYNIVFDESFKPQKIAPQANYADQIISFENDNQNHFIFAVDFQ